MKILDKELDGSPSVRQIIDLAELRIRNLLCFKELESFDRTGKWLGKHPLITHQSEYSKLEELYILDYMRFLDAYNACCNNIKRYESYLNSDKRTDKRTTDKLLLEKHSERKTVFESVIENNKL